MVSIQYQGEGGEMSGDIQYWVADEQHEETKRENGKGANVGKPSLGKYVAVARLLLVGVGVVQVIVLLDIFGEQ